MRHGILSCLVLAAALTACGNRPTPIPPQERTAETPVASDEEIETMRRRLYEGLDPALIGKPGSGGAEQVGSLHGAEAPPMPEAAAMAFSNKAVEVPEGLAERYRGIRVRVTEKATGAAIEYEASLSDPTPLGETGLTITVLAFLPNLNVGPDAVRSVDLEPQNPAAKVRIADDVTDKTGWLFQNAPKLLPIEHERYAFALVGPVQK